MKALVALTVAVVIGCSGCASKQRMTIDDFRTYEIDCANKEAQLRFIRSQRSTKDERMMATLHVNVFDEMKAAISGNKSQDRLLLGRDYDAVAKQLEWQIQSQCADTNRRYRPNSDRYNLQAD